MIDSIGDQEMIDGCAPIQTFFQVVLPISKPTCITVMILQAMWIWNDYLLPSLVLDTKKYRTILWQHKKRMQLIALTGNQGFTAS